VLIEGIVAAVVVLTLAAVLLTRRRSHDDVHSVEGYHRSLHTLEHINAHPAIPAQEGSVHPESAVRVGGTPSVRVTAGVPPPVAFDDIDHSTGVQPPRPAAHRDKAMSSMNHRPRRLAAPALAVAAVIVLVIILLVTGAHKVAPPGHHHRPSTDSKAVAPPSRPSPTTTTTTPTTPAPAVSPPQSSTPSAATYEVSGSEFTLALSATTGACWVDATTAPSGSTLFTGTLQPGDRQTVAATGPVTLVVGAPTVLAVSVDGTPVALPPGFATPFTMHFVTAGAPAS
jgi:hypothetical protein